MVQAMEHEAVERDMDEEAVGAMHGASDGRSNGWYKRWIKKQSKEIYGSESCRRSDGWCKR
jgi:hypothetical protein